MVFLKVNGLSSKYFSSKGPVYAVDDVDFSLEDVQKVQVLTAREDRLKASRQQHGIVEKKDKKVVKRSREELEQEEDADSDDADADAGIGGDDEEEDEFHEPAILTNLEKSQMKKAKVTAKLLKRKLTDAKREEKQLKRVFKRSKGGE